MTSQIRAIELTKLNLHNIFGERNAAKRIRTISNIWGENGEIMFVDNMGVFKTHEAISSVVEKIQNLGGPEDIFIELSDIECLKHDDEEDTWVTRVK
ncbi:NTF2-like domain protein [Stagonosporopsis vannaccii]|nr:NTF2-like domain protein [Stagonosporopsis vannaccii]